MAEGDTSSKEHLLRAIVDSAYDAFVSIDADSIITDWNLQSEKTFGWSRSEAIGRPLAQLILPPRYREAHDSGLKRFLSTGVGPVLGKRIELPALHRSGREIPIELTITAVPEGDTFVFAAFLHDISQRKSAERIQSVQLAVTRILVEAPTISDAFRLTLEALCCDLGWAYGGFWGLEGDLLTPSQMWHGGGEAMRAFETATRRYAFGKGEAMPGRVWASGAATWIRDFADEPSLPRAESARASGLHGTAAFPVQSGDLFVGVIELMSLAPQEPDEPLLQMMADVGARLAMFVERKKADERIRRADERERQVNENEFRVIFELAATGAAQIDPKTTRFVGVNPKFCEMTGYSAVELVGSPFVGVVHPDDLADTVRRLDDLIGRKTANFAAEKRFVGRDGTILWFAVTATVVADADGEPRRIMAILQDVTERRLAEVEQRFLAEASKLLASLDYQTNLTNLAQLIVPTLADWCGVDIVAENGEIERLAVAHVDPKKVEWARELHARYPARPDSPRGVIHVIRSGEPELYPEISEELLKTAAQDPEHLELLRQVGMRSAMIVPLECRGKVLGALTFVATESARRYRERDLTLAREIGRRAAMAVDNARTYRDSVQTNRMKDEFLATLSHELRTPLNSIIGWTELLRSKAVEPDEVEEAIEVIHRNANSQVQLITDLLDVSRIITGKLKIVPVPVDLGAVALNAGGSIELAAKTKGVKLAISTEADVGLVSGDADRLQQVVWNLLTNALRFTPKGGAVSVSVKRSGSNIEIRVADTGEGIEPSFLPHVFERFRQEDSSVTRRHGGLGLGLAIVRHIVEIHGGTVRVESPGKNRGTTFAVALPVISPEPAAAVPPPISHPLPEASAAGGLLSGLRILVVDDDADARRMVRRILKIYGAETVEASSALEAVDVVKSYKPHVLVSDIGMPEVDGYELIRRIRALPDPLLANLPAIALTAYAREEERKEALGAGFFDHISKPVKGSELASLIAKISGRPLVPPKS